MIHRATKRRSTAVTAAVMVVLALFVTAIPAQAAGEAYRPTIHYSPAQNWMNDPNGLVYYKGTYHMYYQYNPYGTTWGNMNWGHATSTDLLTWDEQPLAITQGANEDIFSGSVVVDTTNSSGFGSVANPPLVAVYTSAYHGHPVHGNEQSQSLAYSLDDGYTWTKYSGNPVLDRNSTGFRDPHVFWYDGGSLATRYWVMVAVEADLHQVVIYKSSNLKNWDYLSTFGPANAVGGQWECPDLFKLPIDGVSTNTKWVMVVNINPGGFAGGSGGQYFVGDFNGTTFASESTYIPPASPPGTLFNGFTNYSGWTVNNTRAFASNGPFGTAPATGTLPNQSTVTGNTGSFVNSFLGGDDPIGSMVSAPFTVSSNYVDFKIGGGNHPRALGTGDGSAPAGYTFFNGFESAGTLASQGWAIANTSTDMAVNQPRTYADGAKGFLGDKLINTYGTWGDAARGTLTSPNFTITKAHISALVGGGWQGANLEMRLLIAGAPVRYMGGSENGTLQWKDWDVTQYIGRTDAQLQVIDQETGVWGHILIDNVVNSDVAATPRSTETTVNLLVNGQVVRTATGKDSEALDWTSWNVSQYVGQQAQIAIYDFNSSGWGHILADEIGFASTPLHSTMESYEWLDWGSDYYAAVSFENAPNGKRILLGWMNNWDYAQQVPTSPWRGAMALPRELALTQTNEGPRLTQQVTTTISTLYQASPYTQGAGAISAGTTLLSSSAWAYVAQIDVKFKPGAAQEAGIKVLGNGGTSTVIGYNQLTGRLLVDRRTSGDTSFSTKFSRVETAPVVLAADGSVTLRIIIDAASVEVFADNGKTTMTEIVFPPYGANQVSLYAVGGTAQLDSLTVTKLNPSMFW